MKLMGVLGVLQSIYKNPESKKCQGTQDETHGPA